MAPLCGLSCARRPDADAGVVQYFFLTVVMCDLTVTVFPVFDFRVVWATALFILRVGDLGAFAMISVLAMLKIALMSLG